MTRRQIIAAACGWAGLRTGLPVLRERTGLGPIVRDRVETRSYRMIVVPGPEWPLFNQESSIERICLIAGRKPVEQLEAGPARAPLANGGDAAQEYVVARFDSDEDYIVRWMELVHRPPRAGAR